MLVRFHTRAAAGVTLFGYVAVELLRLMGMSGVVPGAVLAAHVPDALRRLRGAMDSPLGERVPTPDTPTDSSANRNKDEEEEQRGHGVSFRIRAYPLLQLLEAAAAENCDVVWEDADKATG